MNSSAHSKDTRRVDHQYRSAFTLIELLAMMTILAVLVGLGALAASGIRKRAERAACSKNMTSLHLALNTYLTDNKHWPQVTPEGDDEEQFWQAWKNVLLKYELPDKVWMCPTHRRVTHDEFLQYSSYLPTQFDRTSRLTPFKWHQPWVVEIGDNHGDGPLAIFADGSVQALEDLSLDEPKTSLKKR